MAVEGCLYFISLEVFFLFENAISSLILFVHSHS